MRVAQIRDLARTIGLERQGVCATYNRFPGKERDINGHHGRSWVGKPGVDGRRRANDDEEVGRRVDGKPAAARGQDKLVQKRKCQHGHAERNGNVDVGERHGKRGEGVRRH